MSILNVCDSRKCLKLHRLSPFDLAPAFARFGVAGRAGFADILSSSILWDEQRNHLAAVPPITGEMRIESEDAAIGMKFTQSHQAGVR